MSRQDICGDNAPMESLFASLKKESVHGEDFVARLGARPELFECIAVFYNRIRRHSSLGYRSPIDYERAGSTVNPAPAIRGGFQMSRRPFRFSLSSIPNSLRRDRDIRKSENAPDSA